MIVAMAGIPSILSATLQVASEDITLVVAGLVQSYPVTVADTGDPSAILRLPSMLSMPTIHSIVLTMSFTLVHQLVGCGAATMPV